jgi:peptidoglycan/xylan/chitin deacetylase (PgdA/CDA1 family)
MRMRRGAILLVTMVAVLMAGGWAAWRLSRARCYALTPVVCRVQTQAPLVALTFDDGPTDVGVDTVLPLLEAHGAHATFFLIGEQLARRPDLARRLLAAGQELGDHTYTHVRMVGHSQGFYDAQVDRTEQLLARVGSRSGLFRPPYGKKLIGLPIAVRKHRLTMVLWDIEDPLTKDPAAFAREVVSKARPGSIILVHPMYPANTTGRAALPAILDGLQHKGLRAVSVGELLRAAHAS